MAFNLVRAYVQFVSRLLLNATCNCSIFWVVSVNLMGIMLSEDYKELSVCHFLRYFAPG